MLILTHIGQELPVYLDKFLVQLKKFNSDYDIIFLVNEGNCDNEMLKKYNIKTYPIEKLINDRINNFILNLGHGGINSIHTNIQYGGTDYWCVTAVRLFFIYEYCLKHGIKKFFHFENDVMLYESLNTILFKINSNNLFLNQIAITRGTKNKIMTGFMYVGDLEILNHLLFEINDYLESKLDLYSFDIDHLNEMGLLHIYQQLNPKKLVNLPIFPGDGLSDNLEVFQSIFDPATYGQYIDGTPFNPGVSILPESLIKDEMIKNNDIQILFEVINGNRIPFISNNRGIFKINSLHIHSKRLELFLS